MRRAVVVCSVGVLSFIAAPAVPAFAQPPRPLSQDDPVPKGQLVEVKDGDTIVMRGDAHVRMVRRSDASLRAIYNGAQRWLVLLVDYADPKGGRDGFVDSSFTFQNIDGVWPLGEHWQGSAVIDEYSMQDTLGGSLGITTGGAFVQLFSGSSAVPRRWFLDERASVITYGNGGGRANAFPGTARQTFDQMEAPAIADAIRGMQNRSDGPTITSMVGPGGAGITSRVEMMPASTGLAPIRVGGNIRQPAKITDAKATIPPDAAQAGIRGVVILEVVIGVDGRVTDAKILRSIPSLDQAAIDTVRQWRYEVTQLNGQPVPVIMTVTVPFM